MPEATQALEWVTGPVHTGKTTRLAARIAKEAAAYCGILAPVDAEGRRYLVDILSGERRLLSCGPDEPDALAVGPYHFRENVFAWARALLAAHHRHYPTRTLVIDEIGKLELRGAGLAPACWGLLRERERSGQACLIVVRESLIGEVGRALR